MSNTFNVTSMQTLETGSVAILTPYKIVGSPRNVLYTCTVRQERVQGAWHSGKTTTCVNEFVMC